MVAYKRPMVAYERPMVAYKRPCNLKDELVRVEDKKENDVKKRYEEVW